MSETGQLIQPEDFIHFEGFRYYKCCGWYFYLIKIDWCWYGFCLCSSVISSITFWLDWIVPFYCKNNFSVIIKNLYIQVTGNENGRIVEVLRSALLKKFHFFHNHWWVLHVTIDLFCYFHQCNNWCKWFWIYYIAKMDWMRNYIELTFDCAMNCSGYKIDDEIIVVKINTFIMKYSTWCWNTVDDSPCEWREFHTTMPAQSCMPVYTRDIQHPDAQYIGSERSRIQEYRSNFGKFLQFTRFFVIVMDELNKMNVEGMQAMSSIKNCLKNWHQKGVKCQSYKWSIE